MRRLVFAVCTLITVAAMCVFANVYSQKTAAEFSMTAMYYAGKIRFESEIKDYGEKLEKLWIKDRRICSLFMYEDEYTQADIVVGKLKRASSVSDFKAGCEEAAEHIEKTAGAQLPKLENLL